MAVALMLLQGQVETEEQPMVVQAVQEQRLLSQALQSLTLVVVAVLVNMELELAELAGLGAVELAHPQVVELDLVALLELDTLAEVAVAVLMVFLMFLAVTAAQAS